MIDLEKKPKNVGKNENVKEVRLSDFEVRKEGAFGVIDTFALMSALTRK